jgi:uncharacterized protein YaaQ
MKMIIIIVKDHDADTLTRAFTDGQYRVTRIASTSGFLRSGVVTLLVGIEAARVEAAIHLVREALPPSEERRATVFVVPVERFEQI